MLWARFPKVLNYHVPKYPTLELIATEAPAFSVARSSRRRMPRAGRPLLRELDVELVTSLAEREPRLRGVQTHDDSVAVLEPDFAIRLGGDGEVACALDPGNWETSWRL